MYSLMRQVHLYTGFFCIPWLLVYATSGFLINHRAWFKEELSRAREYRVIHEEKFVPGEDFPREDNKRAAAILARLGLEGPFYLSAGDKGKTLIINRPSAGGAYRIVWRGKDHGLVVRRQPFSAIQWVNRLHFISGYQTRYLSADTWAGLVDLVTVSMWLWVITGLYLWYKTAGTRRKVVLGGLCLTTGVVVFAVLAVVFTG